MASFVDYSVGEIRKAVGGKQAVCGLSGGVDSSVAAVLVHKAIGKQLTCIFVNNGVLRKDEAEKVQETFKDMGLNLKYVDASAKFPGEKERGVTYGTIVAIHRGGLGKVPNAGQVSGNNIPARPFAAMNAPLKLQIAAAIKTYILGLPRKRRRK